MNILPKNAASVGSNNTRVLVQGDMLALSKASMATACAGNSRLQSKLDFAKLQQRMLGQAMLQRSNMVDMLNAGTSEKTNLIEQVQILDGTIVSYSGKIDSTLSDLETLLGVDDLRKPLVLEPVPGL